MGEHLGKALSLEAKWASSEGKAELSELKHGTLSVHIKIRGGFEEDKPSGCRVEEKRLDG